MDPDLDRYECNVRCKSLNIVRGTLNFRVPESVSSSCHRLALDAKRTSFVISTSVSSLFETNMKFSLMDLCKSHWLVNFQIDPCTERGNVQCLWLILSAYEEDQLCQLSENVPDLIDRQIGS